jgi:PIN domain nuclease of toxin-antitoxin system
VIVADTHAIIWWVLSPHILSARARDAFDGAIIGVTPTSCYEIARLIVRQRVEIDEDPQDWLENLLMLPRVVLLPLTLDVASAASKLPDAISDPADRLIVATALQARVPLVTKDRKIIASGIVPTIW